MLYVVMSHDGHSFFYKNFLELHSEMNLIHFASIGTPTLEGVPLVFKRELFFRKILNA